jgi:predicted secreted hydrolase
MNRRHWLLLAALPPVAWLAHRVAIPPPPRRVGLPLQTLLGESASDDRFTRAIAPREFVFPVDHAAHPEFRHEWWYFTGNLVDSDSRPFGFQLTFFRFALASQIPSSRSHWRSDQLLLAHFAITDIRAAQFYAHERLHRCALEIAGLGQHPPSVWLKNWRAQLLPERGDTWHLTAQAPEQALALEVNPTKKITAQGTHGLSRKGAGVGNASYYYSQSRLSAAGLLTLGGLQHRVEGTAWLDREWGTSALDATQVGWDWFGLQFDNRCELMFYRLRRIDGAADPHSAGVWITADDEAIHLTSPEVDLDVIDTWTSRTSRVTYPRRWRITIPKLGLDLTLVPRVAAQEWIGRVLYWEGAVEVSGIANALKLAGVGYAEFTGYTP